MKRIFLFVLTNLAIVFTLSVIAQLTGLDRWLAARGGDLTSLLVFAAFFGFAGALISLALSKWSAMRMMGVRVIDAPADADERWLVETVQRLATSEGIGIPQVGIFDSREPNAFATGARRDHALVAVSSGLLGAMSRTELEAVLGHEITHVANGDMVTLTLIQGVVNTFVIFLARVVGNLVDRAVTRDGDNRGGGPAYFVTVMVAQIVLGVLANVIVMWFSRQREFRADRGGARLAGRSNMIAALERLRAAHEPLPAQMDALAIASGGGGGLMGLFMSHPPVEVRIAALKAAAA